MRVWQLLRRWWFLLSVSSSALAVGSAAPVVVVFDALGTPGHISIRGRVLHASDNVRQEANDSALRNLVNNVRILETDELRDAQVQVQLGALRLAATTNEDGLFEVTWQRAPGGAAFALGVHEVVVAVLATPTWAAAQGKGQLRVVAEDACVLVSDIDDTVVETHVTDKARMLSEVLTKNEHQLVPVQGAAAAYQKARAGGVDAVVYLSGSPLAFHQRLQGFLAHNGFPTGPLLLKNLGDDAVLAHTDYKLSRLKALAAAHPRWRFVLVGDAGEHDPEIYAAFREHAGAQVKRIIIRLVEGANNAPERMPNMITVPGAYAHDRVIVEALQP
jgi:phosphatidate phosphatase APP1